MEKQLSMSTKLIILMILAVAFGATLIALSARTGKEFRGLPVREEGDRGKVIEQSFVVSPDGELVLDTELGSLEIVGSDDNTVQLKVTFDGSASDVERFHVNYSQEGNSVTVNGRYDKSHFRFFDYDNINVRFRIRVPKKFNLKLQTSGGEITINDVQGKLVGETSGGDLELAGIGGTINMSTSGGSIRLHRIDGDLTAETSGGDIVADGVTGAMRVETSGGNINITDSDGKVVASTSGGDIRVSLKDNKGIDLSTSGGSIYVKLPKAIAADIEAETTGGDVNCDFTFAGKLKDGSLRGTINGGGNMIRAETSGGDIQIRPVEE